MTDFPVTIFHNPGCSKSRATLELIRVRGIEPEIILYRQTGWNDDRLRGLLERMNLSARDILRTGEAEAAVLGTNASDEVIIAAMIAHPILVERPIVETPLGVVVARPAERVFEVLPAL
ncbi:arsenate reductase family protein [Brevundimonas sp.]|uniref:arsenate reductase family protein n=1 Tax=Brevundimonas sp. TaxID=1871086 RepID=UPI003D0B25D5